MSTTSPHGRGPPASAGVARLDSLLQRSADGDRASFAALYDHTASRAFGLALRLLHERTDAEDAVHQAYLTIWRKAASFDSTKSSGVNWIFTIVHRTAVEHVRSVEPRSARDSRHHREQAHPALDRGAGDRAPDLTDASIEARAVHAALAGISDHQRQAIDMAYFGGWTYREVAQLLNISLGTAKTRIRDGLRNLRGSIPVQETTVARDLNPGDQVSSS